MRKTKFQRGISLLLATAFLVCGAIIPVSAETAEPVKNPTVTQKTIEDYKAELNTVPYSTYLAGKAEGNYQIPSGAFVVDPVTMLDRELSDSRYEIREDGVFTPADGTTAWTFDLPESGWYSITIRYNYSTEGKNTAIEREFYINGKVPFKEAYSVSLAKRYAFSYTDAEYLCGKKDDPAALLKKASDLGLRARQENRSNGTYIVYEIPAYWTEETSNYLTNELGVRFLKKDTSGNELRPTTNQLPEWSEYSLRDSSGYSSEKFMFALDAGETTISLKGVNEPALIGSIVLEPYRPNQTYEEYLAAHKNAANGEGVVKIEAEYATSATTSTVYAVEDRTNAACSPADPSKTLLNTIGGEQWETPGQTLSYRFRVEKSGMYQIAVRYKQDVLEGLYVCRALSLYSEGLNPGDAGYYNGIPFAEAGELQFGYADKWQSGLAHTSDHLNKDGTLAEKGQTLTFYFEAGVTYTAALEVTLGSLGELISEIETALAKLNADYLTIIKLTGNTPDSNRNYGFERLIPSTLIDMYRQADVLESCAVQFRAISGTSTSNTATLESIASLIRKMVRDPDGQIARNLESFKSYLGTLGTFIGDAKKQPLQMDYLTVQAPGEALPRADAGFFRNLLHEILSFWWSFWRDYNQMGSLVENGSQQETLEVWVAYGRDQAQVIRNLITNKFTPTYSQPASLKLVAAGTLLPSILAQAGPDVYLGLTQDDVINYAVRSALLPIENMEGFEETCKEFNNAAIVVLGIEDSEGTMHYYGLPETELFYMMFVRLDILSELNLEIPKTWTDIYAALPVLEAASMQFGIVNDYQIFLYQNGGNLFADNGMRINLDSPVALQSFETLCDFYTAYSCPYIYDAANRFRSGEIPIMIQQYTTLYNQLKVFATEIEGLWTIVPLPGVEDENGNINNCSIATTTAAVMVSGTKEEMKKPAWDFMRWYTGAECQIGYSDDMAAVLGESGKQPTANRSALASLPWTNAEYEEVSRQFENLASVPNYPGAYYIKRYTSFAVAAAYNSGADPRSAILGYINTINNEITRKRLEFNLETLAIGQTLAEKRMGQAMDALNGLEGPEYNALKEEVRYAVANAGRNIKLLNTSAEALNAKAAETAVPEKAKEALKAAATYLTEAAIALATYQ